MLNKIIATRITTFEEVTSAAAAPEQPPFRTERRPSSAPLPGAVAGFGPFRAIGKKALGPREHSPGGDSSGQSGQARSSGSGLLTPATQGAEEGGSFSPERRARSSSHGSTSDQSGDSDELDAFPYDPGAMAASMQASVKELPGNEATLKAVSRLADSIGHLETRGLNLAERFKDFVNAVTTQFEDKPETQIKLIQNYLDAYQKLANTSRQFPGKMQKLITPKILQLSDWQLYLVFGVKFEVRPEDRCLHTLNSPASQESKALFARYQSAVQGLFDSGMTILGEGRKPVHLPWSLAAAKDVMGPLERVRLDIAEKMKTSGADASAVEAFNQEVDDIAHKMSNAIVALVVWAVSVDDCVDVMQKGIPEEKLRPLVHVLKLIAQVKSRAADEGYSSAGLADQIFKQTFLPGAPESKGAEAGESAKPQEETPLIPEIDYLKAKLPDMGSASVNEALAEYVTVAYDAFHGAWKVMEDILGEEGVGGQPKDAQASILGHFSKIMDSFGHSLEVNLTGEPADMEDAKDVHYGMHITVFYDMVKFVVQHMRAKYGLEPLESKYWGQYQNRALLFQQLASIGNIVATGLFGPKQTSRELQDCDLSNRLINKMLIASEAEATPDSLALCKKIQAYIDRFQAFKKENASLFAASIDSDESISGPAKKRLEEIKAEWDRLVEEISDELPDYSQTLYHEWYTNFIAMKRYNGIDVSAGGKHPNGGKHPKYFLTIIELVLMFMLRSACFRGEL